MLTMISSVSKNGVIAKYGDMPWGRKLKDDLRFFKDTTISKTVVVGRITQQSIFQALGKNLPDRKTVVLTKDKMLGFPGCMVVDSVEEIIRMSKLVDLFVIGGGKIYEQLMPVADKLIITHVDTVVEDGEVFFPEINPNLWEPTELKRQEADQRNIFSFTIVEYTRKPRL
jgi:dihydrofolate reductase